LGSNIACKGAGAVTHFFKSIPLLAFVPLLALSASTPARADLVLVTDRSAVSANSAVDWGVLGNFGTLVPNNFMITPTGGGVPVIVSKPVTPGAFERTDENATLNLWNGNFTKGDKLLWTTAEGGPVTLNFGSRGISAGGAQIQPDFFGPFTAKLEAFDATGKSLGSVTEDGVSNMNEDGSAIFLGVLSTTGLDIHMLTFSLTAGSAFDTQDFAINLFSFNDQPSVTPPPGIPEPGSLALMGLGLVGLGCYGWRRHRRC
jgi:hypothetical protein